MTGFQAKNGTVPFPRTEDEWIAKGLARDVPLEQATQEAKHRLRQDVFGHDYKTDAKGNPIERGKGSIAQPTAQHQQALMISNDAEVSRKMRMGWHPGLEQAFDPRSAAPARKKKRAKAKPAAEMQ